MRNRAESLYPSDLNALVYNRLQHLSRFEGLKNITEETIEAVRKLYLSKNPIPKKGHTIFFCNGEPITGWFDESKGLPEEIVNILYKEPQVPYFSELV